jgi:CheY-like chemotaxis protein
MNRKTRAIENPSIAPLAPGHSNGTAPHILVLDDAEDVLDLFRDVLEEDGYRVTVGLTPLDPQTIAMLQPDLLILDLVFAGENLGVELLGQLRLDAATSDLPVIICSASFDAIDQLQTGGNHAVSGWLLKPFDLDALESEMARALEPAARGTESDGFARSQAFAQHQSDRSWTSGLPPA